MARATSAITGASRYHGDGGDDLVFDRLDDAAPVAERLVEDIEERHVADVGVGPRPVVQFLRIGAEADIDRQYPKPFENLQQPFFGRQRQGDQQQVDAGPAHELDEFGDIAKLGQAADLWRRAHVVAVVEHADNRNIGCVRSRQRGHEFGRRLAAAHQHRMRGRAGHCWFHRRTIMAAMARPSSNAERPPKIPAEQPHARIVGTRLGEHHADGDGCEQQAPGWPPALTICLAGHEQGLDAVEPEDLGNEWKGDAGGQHQRQIDCRFAKRAEARVERAINKPTRATSSPSAMRMVAAITRVETSGAWASEDGFGPASRP